MRQLVLAAAVLAAAVPPASAVPPPTGVTCNMATSGGPYQAGIVWAGPVIADPAIGPVAIRCSVQLDFAGHNAPDVASVTGQFGNPAVLPPTPISYPALPGQRVYLCTEYLDTHGGVYRYDDPATPFPDDCVEATRTETPDGGQAYTVFHDQKCIVIPQTSPPSKVCIPWPDPIPWPFEA